jgi:anti-anti-sigma factor
MAQVSLTRVSDALMVVECDGEFDLSNADRVADAATAAIGDPGSRVIAVDLGHVTFFDSKLLHTLVIARDAAQRASKAVWLVRPPASLWRVFEITALDALFPNFASLAELEQRLEGGASPSSPELPDQAPPRAVEC